ncbi:MAG: DUF4184 family protein [Terracidiphilus sp.]
MPFTLSHAAAALPFRRTRLEFSALVTGCFAPDFAYFIFLRPRGFYGHTLPGVFVFDLPASLVVLWLFHAYVKQPLLTFLPTEFRRRLTLKQNGYSFWPPARLALIVISILIGTATHILWDSLTHSRYWPYRHWSFLRQSIHVPVAGNVAMYLVLQHASTLFGLTVLAVWVWFWYRTTEPSESPLAEPFTPAQLRIITVIVPVVAICGGLVRAVMGAGIPGSIKSIVLFVGEWGLAAITFFAIGLLFCGVFFRKRALSAV